MFFVFFFGCTATKNIMTLSSKDQIFLDSVSLKKEFKTYSLQIPETWYSYKEIHGLIMHSPKIMLKRDDNFYTNNFYVSECSPKICEAESIEAFLKFYLKKMKKIYPKVDFYPVKLKHEIYGEYYLVKYGTFWSKEKKFTNISILFHYKKRNFELKYTSENKYYDEFIKDVESIVKSFTIIEFN